MSCNNCNDYKPCESKCTGCPVKDLYGNCVNLALGVLPCSGINANDTLDNVLKKMDQHICDKFDSLTNFISLTNVGGGSEIYKGVSVIGEKEIRTLTSTNGSVTITQTTDNIDLSVIEVVPPSVLDDLSDVNAPSPTAGDILVWDGSWNTAPNSIPNSSLITIQPSDGITGGGTFNINQSVDQTIDIGIDIGSIGTGNPIYIGQNAVSGTLEVSSITDTSTTGYTPIYLGYNVGNHGFAGITSSSLDISTNAQGNITIESVPDFANEGVPRFIVNNLYTGTEELGTISKPFKTIQNAVDSFVGTGDAESPQYQNGVIVIQKGNTYNYDGHFSYRNINVLFEEGVMMTHQPSSGGYLYNSDILDDNVDSDSTFTLSAGVNISLTQNGFKHRGSINTATGDKQLNINGTGRITGTGVYDNTISVIEANFNNLPNYKITGNGIFIRGVRIESRIPIWKVGGGTSITLEGVNIRVANSGAPGNVYMEQKGGNIYLTNSNITITEYLTNPNVDSIFYITKDDVNFIPYMEMNNNIIQTDGVANNLFKILDPNNLQGTLQPTITCASNVTRFSKFTKLFESTTFLTNAKVSYNVFETGVAGDIDLTLNNTTSTQNIIGGNVVESLVSYTDSAAAQADGLYSGCKFINTTTNTVDIVI